MDLNTMLIVVTLAGGLIFVIFKFIQSRARLDVEIEEKYMTLDDVIDGVKQYAADITMEDPNIVISREDFERANQRRTRIKMALERAPFGIDEDKERVKMLLTEYIENNVPMESVDMILGLNVEEGGEPSAHVMFEILMYRYKKRYGKGALQAWIDEYNLNRERPAQDVDDVFAKQYYITEDDVHQTYYDYFSKAPALLDQEKREILATIVFINWKGFGAVDTVREMNINGVNIGTSGSLLNGTTSPDGMPVSKGTNSAWIFYKGVQIHLEWIDFGTMEEIKRIVTLICRWNMPGALTAKRGFLVNTMYDKSRVLALRPPACESWAVFIRKFNLSNLTPEFLLDKPYTNRADLILNLLKYIVKGKVTSAICGRQGSGKTTLLSAIIRYINPKSTIRVLEMAPELYLRELYPSRNIVSLQETPTVTAEMEQDALKKSDGVVSLVGEVATDGVARNMVQMAMTASECTYFTHHGNTPKDTIITLRNSLASSGNFSMETAEKQVTDAVRVIVHLNRDSNGKVYCDLVSEIVQKEEGIPYPDYDPNDPVNSMNRISAEMAYRLTDRISFSARTILRYDADTDTYVPVNRFTRATEDRIRGCIESPEEKKLFDYFMLENWGVSQCDIDELYDKSKLTELSDSNIPTPIINELMKMNLSDGKPTPSQLAEARQAVLDSLTSQTAGARAYEEQHKLDKNSEEYQQGIKDVEVIEGFIEGAQKLKIEEQTREDLSDEFTMGLFDL